MFIQAFDVLSNMVYAPLKMSSPKDGVERISAIEGIPEIIYIVLDFIAPENYHKTDQSLRGHDDENHTHTNPHGRRADWRAGHRCL